MRSIYRLQNARQYIVIYQTYCRIFLFKNNVIHCQATAVSGIKCFSFIMQTFEAIYNNVNLNITTLSSL